jgi:hypothetical protein
MAMDRKRVREVCVPADDSARGLLMEWTQGVCEVWGDAGASRSPWIQLVGLRQSPFLEGP